MSKQKRPRALDEKSCLAKLSMIRVSPQKLGLVAASIRRLPARRALQVLSFSPKAVARDVKKLLQSAIANAENNHGLDVDLLRVEEVTVGRALKLRRLDIKGRSRSGRIEKPFSNLRLVLREAERGV